MVAFLPMSEQDYYSVRMISQREGSHHSGAEVLVPFSDLDHVSRQLIHRALNHPRGEADSLRVSIDRVPRDTIDVFPLPDVFSWECRSVEKGRAAAASLLRQAGVSPQAIRVAMACLGQGAVGGGANMRGAMLVDAASGGRLEPDYLRGVRVSRMGLAPDTRESLILSLNAQGLTHSNTREALVLAAKVMQAPEVVAELCWSDDPDYGTGYVASRQLGYHRLTPLKGEGDLHGGRAFFVRTGAADLSRLIDYLERAPVLLHRPATIHATRPWEEVHDQL